MTNNADEALLRLEERDWSGGQADTEPGTTSIVFSARLKGELAGWVASEADRRGVNPSVVIRDAVAAARAAAAADETISVTRGDLHRLIDRLPAA
jgi:hypothetical protein